MATRRGFLGSVLAACAAPAIVLTPGVLMKGRPQRVWVALSPKLVIYSGLPDIVGSSQLASIELQDDWLSSATGGLTTVKGYGTIDMSGTASYFEIVQPDGKWAVRGKVSEVLGNGDLKINNTAFCRGDIISLTGLTIGSA